MREFLFVAAEGGRVIVPAPVVVNGRMVDVQHFVKDDIFDDVSRHIRRVERTADDDRVVRRIMMPQNAVSVPGRPRKHWFFNASAEIFRVHAFKDLVQVVYLARVSRNDLAAARSAALVRAFAHVGRFYPV